MLALDDSAIRRFLSKLRRAPSGCLEFTGDRNKPNGHGRFWLVDANELAHRVAFVLAGGVLTEERPCVLHSCDNPICCEPSHLRAGTKAENAEDMGRRERGRKSLKGMPYGAAPRPSGRFQALAQVDGKVRGFGTFDTPEEASAAAKAGRLAARGW